MTPIALATEDVLSESVGVRLIRELPGHFEVGTLLRKSGSGYLRARVGNFCELARHQLVLVITDLDQKSCPKRLISDWFGNRVIPASLVFRVAVREVESWLLADHDAIRNFFGKPQLRLPDSPDTLPDPKNYLVQLARKGPRSVREALVPERGSTAAQGLGYNQLLLSSVVPHWNPAVAEQRSESLRRARFRLQEMAAAWIK